MAITINISGEIIDFPSTAASPDWSPALIQFAQAVESAISGFAGPFDVPPQIEIIDAYNPGISIDMPNFAFPVSAVRGVDITYTVFRQTSTNTAAEKGTIQAVYNPDGPVGNKWNTSRELTGDGFISFYITDTGQMQFTTTTIPGTSHTGRLAYSAKSILQDT